MDIQELFSPNKEMEILQSSINISKLSESKFLPESLVNEINYDDIENEENFFIINSGEKTRCNSRGNGSDVNKNISKDFKGCLENLEKLNPFQDNNKNVPDEDDTRTVNRKKSNNNLRNNFNYNAHLFSNDLNFSKNSNISNTSNNHNFQNNTFLTSNTNISNNMNLGNKIYNNVLTQINPHMPTIKPNSHKNINTHNFASQYFASQNYMFSGNPGLNNENCISNRQPRSGVISKKNSSNSVNSFSNMNNTPAPTSTREKFIIPYNISNITPDNNNKFIMNPNRIWNSNTNVCMYNRFKDPFFNELNNQTSTNLFDTHSMKKTFSSSSCINKNQEYMLFDEILSEPHEDFDVFIAKIGNNLMYLINTQRGSRFMQKMINKMPSSNVDKLLKILAFNFKEVIINNYGNYFMQKFIRACNNQQMMILMKDVNKYIYIKIAPYFLEISNNESGTHFIQSLIEIISNSEERLMIQECIENYILKISYNPNGTHIIQRIIVCFEESDRKFLNDFLIENLVKMCTNAYAMCVVKKFINCNKDQEIKNKLIRTFDENITEILEDSFGNYAIQHIIDVYGTESCENIINNIIGNIVQFSNQKFSSNVVEKCIYMSNKETLLKIIKEVFLNNSNFISLLRNKYGTFVLHKAISVLNPNQKIEMKKFLLKNINVNGIKEKNKFVVIMELLDNNNNSIINFQL